MNLPGFTAEGSLYRTSSPYQSLRRTPANGSGVEMATPIRATWGPSGEVDITCYQNGSVTECDVISCITAGTCDLVVLHDLAHKIV